MNKKFLLLTLIAVPFAIAAADDADEKRSHNNRMRLEFVPDDPHFSRIIDSEFTASDFQNAKRAGLTKVTAEHYYWRNSREFGPSTKEKMSSALEHGVISGVSEGVATVVAKAIIVAVSKPFGFVWDKTCSCYSYITTPREEKLLLARMTKLGNQAGKLQTDLELKKLEIKMTQNEFALMEKEKELKTLKDQLQIAKDKEKQRVVQEFLASQPKHNPYSADLPAPTAPQAAPAA